MSGLDGELDNLQLEAESNKAGDQAAEHLDKGGKAAKKSLDEVKGGLSHTLESGVKDAEAKANSAKDSAADAGGKAADRAGEARDATAVSFWVWFECLVCVFGDVALLGEVR